MEIYAKSNDEAEKILREEVKSGSPLHLKEKEEPTNWEEKAEMYANDIIDNNKGEFLEVITDKIKDGETDEDEIFDALYQGKDLTSLCNEEIDGQFIYNDTKSIKEALDCINYNSDWEETDKGLWEEMESIEEIINAKAFYTLKNGVYEYLERNLKSLIAEELEKAEAKN
jgi:hypothetical protein